MLKTVAKLNQEEEDKVKKAYETNQLLIKSQNEQVCITILTFSKKNLIIQKGGIRTYRLNIEIKLKNNV